MKKKYTKICIVCGKEFIKPETCSYIDWFGGKRRPNGKRFCSKKCSNENRKGKPSWNKGISWTEEFRQRIIEIKKGKHYSPDTEFKKGQIAWNKGLNGEYYLSEESRKKMSVWGGKQGEGTPNWRGGTTKLGQLIRSCRKYRDWREKIFNRDNRTCVKCRVENVPIHADHIKPFYEIIKENNIKTVEQAKQCKELWDINNGRTLCIPCHTRTTSYLNSQRQKS